MTTGKAKETQNCSRSKLHDWAWVPIVVLLAGILIKVGGYKTTIDSLSVTIKSMESDITDLKVNQATMKGYMMELRGRSAGEEVRSTGGNEQQATGS